MAKKTHTHTVGRFSFDGATKAEAKKAFEAAVTSYCETLNSYAEGGFHVENRFGSTFIIWRDLYGWNVRFIGADSPLGHGESYNYASASGGTEPIANVVQSYRLHSAQYAWNPETDDATHIAASGLNASKADDLQRWICFQRSYREHKAAGRSDSEAFDMAHSRA